MTRADVRYVFVDDSVTAEDLAAAWTLLSTEEQERSRRFHFDADRRQFVVAHALTRIMLSDSRPDVPPSAWQFEPGPHGKPEVAAPADATNLRFNLSHTCGLAACIVSTRIEVGIDVETDTRRINGMELAARVFSSPERESLGRLAPAARPHVFLQYWTLKEAYVKARGAGLSLPLDRFWFELHESASPRITFAADLADEAHRWQFQQFRPSSEHWMAVALDRGSGPDVAISYRQLPAGSLGAHR